MGRLAKLADDTDDFQIGDSTILLLVNLKFGWSQWAKQVHSTYTSLSFPMFYFQSMIAVKLNGMFLTVVNSQIPVWSYLFFRC